MIRISYRGVHLFKVWALLRSKYDDADFLSRKYTRGSYYSKDRIKNKSWIYSKPVYVAATDEKKEWPRLTRKKSDPVCPLRLSASSVRLVRISYRGVHLFKVWALLRSKYDDADFLSRKYTRKSYYYSKDRVKNK